MITMLRPEICVSIGDLPLPAILDRLAEASLAEIRIDLLHLEPEELNGIFRGHSNLIATCRAGRFTDSQRAQRLEQALAHGAAYVDLEIETSARWREPIIARARALSRRVIISYHNYHTTPSEQELEEIIAAMRAAGADLAKIASFAQNPAHSARILGLYARHANLIAVGMGPHGAITRIAAPLLGAPFTFAAIPGHATAPGQLDYAHLEQILQTIGSPPQGND